MTDKELLKLAAKAAGVKLEEHIGLRKDYFANAITGEEWNPLTDDGDALRLAVKLRIGLGDRETLVTAFHKQSMSKGAVYVEEFGDHLAATRRAIVRAAAEIGKQNEHQ